MTPDSNPAVRSEALPGRYLTFTLGRESYGVPVLSVREIIRLCPITPVPQMPAHLRGVINLRGKVIPVLDLRGTQDAYGRELMVTEVCIVDELAAAAELVMGKATGVPVAVIRGVDPEWFVGESAERHGVLTDVVRSPADDLFR